MTRIALTIAALMAVSGPVMAQTACGERSRVIETLATKFQEQPTAVGIAANGAAVELIRAEDGKTWTLIVTYPSGMSCALASGNDWDSVTPKYGVEG